MASITDQIDLFHEQVCRIHLYEEILDKTPQTWSNVKVKTKYYTSEEYLQSQKQLLLSDLKTLIYKQG